MRAVMVGRRFGFPNHRAIRRPQDGAPRLLCLWKEDGRALPDAHLSDDETVAKMGHPDCAASFVLGDEAEFAELVEEVEEGVGGGLVVVEAEEPALGHVVDGFQGDA